MKSLSNDRKLVLAALAALAVFGSFLVGVVSFAILKGLGMNEDLAWGLSVLLWIAVVALGVLGIVYDSPIRQRLDQVTGRRPAGTPPATPNTPPSGAERLDEPPPTATPSSSYRDMLTKKDSKGDRDG